MPLKSFFLILSLCCYLSSCKESTSPKLYPSDYLFAQRSFPHNKIDDKAYRRSLKDIESYKVSRKTPFNDPWFNLGPFNFDGRISDLEIHPDSDNRLFAAAASGGVFRSDDGGNSWIPIFDESPTLSIGDIAIYKKDPNVMYVGTGEANAGGGSLAYDGLGVFKTTNGGNNWQPLGPSSIGSIGRIAIDPNDSDKVFIATMGSLFANNSERGVYRSTDGGDNWQQVLMVSDSTGAIDLAIHPNNGKIVYAAMWERIRRPHNRQYGGATSGIFKSQDGGDTWQELTNGLPTDDSMKGRIGLAISESAPHILYAYYASSSGSIAGVFKTVNGGDTWIEMNSSSIPNSGFNWWFGKIFVDAQDSEKVFVTSLGMYASVDGGESWDEIFDGVHVDQHALAFGNENPDLIYCGNDGGVYKSRDGGNADVSYMAGLGNFQFYTCKIDPNNAEVIYGGAQDNGTVKYEGNSSGWRTIFGGDGFRVLVDPNNSDQLYYEFQNGNIYSSSNGGNTQSRITAGITGLFNWNTPLAMDANATSTIYTGTQALYRSEDKGLNWEKISNDLVSSNNPMGIISYGTLTTIDVSTLNSDIIYVGTDDGNVWVSQDYGLSFSSVNEGIPRRWITSVSHDPHLVSGVYLTVSGFRFGESSGQVFYSDNYGYEWKNIGEGLPDIPSNDIVIDTKVRGLIYLATDIGVFYSDDNGSNWKVLGNSMPIVPIIDLDFHSETRRLAAASFGRGLFVYDVKDISANTEIGEDLDINIYPNPTKEYVDIESAQKINKIELYDINGKQVSIVTTDLRIDVSSISNGIYFLVLHSNEAYVIRRLVKSR